MSKERESKKMTSVGEEEKKRILEKVEMIKTCNPETIHYFEKKKPYTKSGRGGKFTWEGPGGPVEGELDPVPPAIDPRDPNYVEEEAIDVAATGEGYEKPAVIGQVEVAKVAEAKEGVYRIEVQPPLQPAILIE